MSIWARLLFKRVQPEWVEVVVENGVADTDVGRFFVVVFDSLIRSFVCA